MISPFAGFTIVVVASKNLPVHSLKELVDYAKANPGKLNYGSVGIGSSQHLAGEYFSQVTGMKMTHVPYRNIAQYGPDLIAGRCRSASSGSRTSPARSAPRAPSRSRSRATSALPRCRTRRPPPKPACRNTRINGWFALLAPAGTPKPILERLNKEMKAALEDPQVKKGFESAGAETMWMPLDQVEEIASRRDRQVPRHHHQGRHRADRVGARA